MQNACLGFRNLQYENNETLTWKACYQTIKPLHCFYIVLWQARNDAYNIQALTPIKGSRLISKPRKYQTEQSAWDNLAELQFRVDSKHFCDCHLPKTTQPKGEVRKQATYSGSVFEILIFTF